MYYENFQNDLSLMHDKIHSYQNKITDLFKNLQ